MKNQFFKCRICESEETNDWVFREMMFGLRDEFKYKECISCGCIQIENYPKHIENYYPPNYYSFNKILGISKEKFQQAKTAVLLYNHLVFNDVLGKLGKQTYPPLDGDLNYLNKINLKPWSRILDIGCGNGDFLV
ncbi:MAG: hypothetical protein ACTHJN_01850, partial [Ginsengibacter sp.]